MVLSVSVVLTVSQVWEFGLKPETRMPVMKWRCCFFCNPKLDPKKRTWATRGLSSIRGGFKNCLFSTRTLGAWSNLTFESNKPNHVICMRYLDVDSLCDKNQVFSSSRRRQALTRCPINWAESIHTGWNFSLIFFVDSHEGPRAPGCLGFFRDSIKP